MDTDSISTTENDNGILECDKQRYQRKGYGLFFAFIITIASFTIGPKVLRYEIELIQGYQAKVMVPLILIITHLAIFSIGNLIMMYIYSAKIPFFERYRIRNIPWPWEEENKQEWNVKLNKVIKVLITNFLLGCLMSVIDGLVAPESDLPRIDIESFPSLFELMWQTVFCMFMEDTMFYWSHRLLHHPKLYVRIHKKHHEFNNPVGFISEYAHPLEYVLGNVLPTFIGAKILRSNMHFATLQFYFIIRVLETIDGHCGYEFSWSPYRLLPFSTSTEYHNYHHSHNVGNYESFFCFWDTLCGTNKSFRKFQQEQKRIQKLQLLKEQYKAKNE